MSIASKYNKSHLFNYEIPKDAAYVKLGELYKQFGPDKTYTVRAMYISNKSKYSDESPVVAIDEAMVNFPTFMTDTIKDMMHDDEVIEAVNSGKLGFKIYQYEMKQYKGRIFFGATWIDL